MRLIADIQHLAMLPPMPSRMMLFIFVNMAAQAAAAATPALNPETTKRVRAFQEEQTYPLPSEKEVDTAEQVLASLPCIGKLDKWNRRYARKVDWQNGHVDHDLLWFNFREAGLYGYQSGRKIGRLRDVAEVDDRQFRLASGVYNLRTRQVKLDSCGSNWPERHASRSRERRR